jgi:U-box domain
MADTADGYNDSSTHSTDSYHETIHIEPLYEAFLCPITRKIMQDPVTLETGQTFEQEAIEKWLRECNLNGKPPICPVTKKVLTSTELNPSIALRNTIEEWTQRNEAARLDVARRSLYVGNSEADALQALDYVIDICRMNRAHKNFARIGELIRLIADMLKSTSRRVRLKALETLRILSEEDDDNKVSFNFLWL